MSHDKKLAALAEQIQGIGNFALNHFPDTVEERIRDLGKKALVELKAKGVSPEEIQNFNDNLENLIESVNYLRNFDGEVDELARNLEALSAPRSASKTPAEKE